MNVLEDILRKTLLLALVLVLGSGIFYSTYKHFHPGWDMPVSPVAQGTQVIPPAMVQATPATESRETPDNAVFSNTATSAGYASEPKAMPLP
jgi:hypothetical protein